MDVANKREHYNLYYIFKEDKEATVIKKTAAEMWVSILSQTGLNHNTNAPPE